MSELRRERIGKLLEPTAYDISTEIGAVTKMKGTKCQLSDLGGDFEEGTARCDATVTCTKYSELGQRSGEESAGGN